MSENLIWKPDKDKYEHVDGDRRATIRDAYAQWIMRPQGRDFELSNELIKQDEEDFSYVEVFETLTGSGEIRNSYDACVVPFDFASCAVDDPSRRTSDECEVFAALPIRKRSVLPPDVDVSEAVYTAPLADGFDPKKLVIVGLIDDSINVCHERFQTGASDTRVEFSWIQDADIQENSTVAFGRELSRDEISTAIREFGDNQDAMLEHLGLVGRPGAPYRQNALNLRASHGTHVADLAAGYPIDLVNDPEIGLDPVNRRLITVQLPALATQDTSAASLVAAARSAIWFIFNRAKLISEALQVPVPVVLCFSYAVSGGSRTGQHLLERVLRAFALDYRRETAKYTNKNRPFGAPVQIVVPAGNQHLTRSHTMSDVAQEGSGVTGLELNMRLQPEDRTSSYLEIWVPWSATEIHLQVQPPCGGVLEQSYAGLAPCECKNRPAQLHASNILTDPDGENIRCRVSLDQPNNELPQGSNSNLLWWRILIAFAPTKVLDGGRFPAPHGSWKVNVRSNQIESPTHSWIQRDVAMPGFGRRGRQPYFDDPAYENARFDSLGDVSIDDDHPATSAVTRNGTLSGLATCRQLAAENSIKETDGNKANSYLDTIVVGASRWDTGAATLFSGAGFLDGHGRIEAPTAMAQSQTSRVLPNILCAGSRNGSKTPQSGTSFSAPQIARLLADQIALQSIADRIDFDGISILAQLGEHPSRPAGKEIATRPAIRKERLRESGKLHMPAPQNLTGISRDSRRKV